MDPNLSPLYTVGVFLPLNGIILLMIVYLKNISAIKDESGSLVRKSKMTRVSVR